MKHTLLALVFLAIGCGGNTTTSDVNQSPDSSTPTGGSMDSGLADAAKDSGLADAAKDSGLADVGTDSQIAPAEGQRILFEMSRVNFAWGPSTSGMYVTASGEVYTYDFYKNAPDAAAPYTNLVPGMTEQQVTAKYGSEPKLIGTIGKDELLARYAQIGDALRGMLLTQGLCADYGMDRFIGYTFDVSTSTYTPVMLGIDGDMSMHNTSTAANDLITWLLDKAQWTGTRSCQYHTTSCAGELCPGLPSCTKGQVPIYPSDAGCLKNCGSPVQCTSVSDCSVCAKANHACLIDPDGARHCAYWAENCNGAIGCECGDDSLCAGGKAYCHGTAAEGISCTAP